MNNDAIMNSLIKFKITEKDLNDENFLKQINIYFDQINNETGFADGYSMLIKRYINRYMNSDDCICLKVSEILIKKMPDCKEKFDLIHNLIATSSTNDEAKFYINGHSFAMDTRSNKHIKITDIFLEELYRIFGRELNSKTEFNSKNKERIFINKISESKDLIAHNLQKSMQLENSELNNLSPHLEKLRSTTRKRKHEELSGKNMLYFTNTFNILNKNTEKTAEKYKSLVLLANICEFLEKNIKIIQSKEYIEGAKPLQTTSTEIDCVNKLINDEMKSNPNFKNFFIDFALEAKKDEVLKFNLIG